MKEIMNKLKTWLLILVFMAYSSYLVADKPAAHGHKSKSAFPLACPLSKLITCELMDLVIGTWCRAR